MNQDFWAGFEKEAINFKSFANVVEGSVRAGKAGKAVINPANFMTRTVNKVKKNPLKSAGGAAAAAGALGYAAGSRGNQQQYG